MARMTQPTPNEPGPQQPPNEPGPQRPPTAPGPQRPPKAPGPQRPPTEPGPLTRLGRRYASGRRPWSLAVAALALGAGAMVVGGFLLANRQFALGLGLAAAGVVLAWLLRVRVP